MVILMQKVKGTRRHIQQCGLFVLRNIFSPDSKNGLHFLPINFPTVTSDFDIFLQSLKSLIKFSKFSGRVPAQHILPLDLTGRGRNSNLLRSTRDFQKNYV